MTTRPAGISALLKAGRLTEAEVLARGACDQRPLDADAWYLQAAIHAMRGHWADVTRCCRRVIELNPDHVEAHCNLGAALASLRQFPEAAEAFRRALQSRPDLVEASLGLGCALQSLGRPADARAHLEAAIALDPGRAEAHGRLGAVLSEMGRWDEAIRCFNRVLALEPGHLSALINLGAALRARGRLTEAAETYRRALDLHPDSELARYFAATVGEEPPPRQAPETYVRELFDSYAARFDDDLVRNLRYSTPTLIAATLGGIPGAWSGHARVLDLGCGTGLVGQAIRGAAARLVGVDLSGRMIEAVGRKNLYDELHVAELGAFLATDEASYDLIIAADVFIYVGDLSTILANATRRLAPGGLLVFSVERHAGDQPYVLRNSGRYAHSPAWVRYSARAAGLGEVRAVEHVLRVEAETGIVGDLFVFRA